MTEYVRPSIEMPGDLWDAVILHAKIAKVSPSAVICEQIAQFLINDFEAEAIEQLKERAIDARGGARNYLARANDF